MCLFCTLMFVFSALLVFSNSLERWGCCWIVRFTVGCWLEVTVNGLIMLVRDILRNTKDVAFTFLGEGGERERMCVDEWTYTAGPPRCSVKNGWLPLTTSFASQGNDGFCFVFLGCSQCAWLTHACKAMRPFLLKSSSSLSWGVWVPELGRASTDTAMGHAASQHLHADVSQGCCGLVPSFEPALAWCGWKVSQFGKLSWERTNAMRKK